MTEIKINQGAISGAAEEMPEEMPEEIPEEAVSKAASMLFMYFRDQDVQCPRCGYNLRNHNREHCPEYGSELVLRVGIADPFAAAFLTLLIFLGIGLGISLLLAIAAIFGEAPNRWWTSLGAVGVFGQLAFSSVGLIYCVRSRRQILIKPVSAQWVMAAVTFLLLAGMTSLFFMFVG